MRSSPARTLAALILAGAALGVPVASGAPELARAAHAASGSARAASVSPRVGGLCAGIAPRRLHLTRLKGRRARLSWSVSGHSASVGAGVFRVLRSGRTVGQTTAASIVMRITPGRLTKYTVQALHPGAPTCAAALRIRLPFRPPGPVTKLRVIARTSGGVLIGWRAAAFGDAPVAGYRVERDGAVAGQIRTFSFWLRLSSGRSHRVQVLAVDTRGHLGAAKTLVIGAQPQAASSPHTSSPAQSTTQPTPKRSATHTPPPAPTGLAVSQLTSKSAVVSWSPSTPVSGVIVGYRVFRNEIPVGQVDATEMTLANLAPSSEYQVTVSAVDSLGAISEPSAPLVIHTAEPLPSVGNVQAYLLASTDQSFEDLQAHYQQIGVLYPTYFNCGAGGEVEGKDDPLVTKWALARKIEVLPRINCQNVADEEQILGEPAAREKMIDQLAALCASYGYTGVQLDFEGAPPSARNPFTAFVTALAERLHAQGNKLSTVVTAKYYNVLTGRAAMYDDAALSVPSDYMFVLDWGLHWQTSGPGSIDEYPWFKRIAEYTATLPNRDKFVLGMPMYGIDWPDGGGPSHRGTALEFSEIAALASELSITPEWEATAESPHFSYTDGEGVHHEVWYTDQQSIGARAELASSLGLGVGLWRLGSEDQSVWELTQLGGSG